MKYLCCSLCRIKEHLSCEHWLGVFLILYDWFTENYEKIFIITYYSGLDFAVPFLISNYNNILYTKV